MFSVLNIVSGLVKLGNMLMAWAQRNQDIQTGKTLQQGEQDAATLENIKKGQDARDHATDADTAKSLDNELCIDKPTKADNV